MASKEDTSLTNILSYDSDQSSANGANAESTEAGNECEQVAASEATAQPTNATTKDVAPETVPEEHAEKAQGPPLVVEDGGRVSMKRARMEDEDEARDDDNMPARKILKTEVEQEEGGGIHETSRENSDKPQPAEQEVSCEKSAVHDNDGPPVVVSVGAENGSDAHRDNEDKAAVEETAGAGHASATHDVSTTHMVEDSEGTGDGSARDGDREGKEAVAKEKEGDDDKMKEGDDDKTSLASQGELGAPESSSEGVREGETLQDTSEMSGKDGIPEMPAGGVNVSTREEIKSLAPSGTGADSNSGMQHAPPVDPKEPNMPPIAGNGGDMRAGEETCVGSDIPSNVRTNTNPIAVPATNEISLMPAIEAPQIPKAAPEASSTVNKASLPSGGQDSEKPISQQLPSQTTPSIRPEPRPDQNQARQSNDRETEYANFVANHGLNTTPSAKVTPYPMTPSSVDRMGTQMDPQSAKGLGGDGQMISRVDLTPKTPAPIRGRPPGSKNKKSDTEKTKRFSLDSLSLGESGKKKNVPRFDPPEDPAKFLSFVIFYLRVEQRSQEADDLLDPSKMPTVCGQAVNLCELYHIVQNKGGKNRMHRRLWKTVLNEMKLSADVQADAKELENIYNTYLQFCEDKTWNPEDLKKNAEDLARDPSSVTLKQLLDAGFLSLDAELYWQKKHPEKGLLGPVFGKITLDGQIEFEGQKHKTPAAFASAACKSLTGRSLKRKHDGWSSVRYRNRTLEYYKSQYIDRNSRKNITGMLQPEQYFAAHTNLLSKQKEIIEQREEEERNRALAQEREKSAAKKPPPLWMSPEEDARVAEEISKGNVVVNTTLIAQIESESLKGAEEARKFLSSVITAIRNGTMPELVSGLTVTPRALNSLSKCFWYWIRRTNYVPPRGQWKIDDDMIERLHEELAPKRRRVGRALKHGLRMSRWNASHLPPGWRREIRDVTLGYYNYILPDGKVFPTFAKAHEWYSGITQQERDIIDAKAASQIDGAMPGQSAEQGQANAGGEEAGQAMSEEEGNGEGGNAQGKREGPVDSEQVGIDETNALKEEDSENERVNDEGQDASDRPPLPEAAAGTQGAEDEQEKYKLWFCSCCSKPVCQNVVMEDFISRKLCPEFDECQQYAAVVREYLILLKHLCQINKGMQRIGSNASTLQLLIEVVLAGAHSNFDHKPLDHLAIEVLLAVAPVINLRVSPGTRILSLISDALTRACDSHRFDTASMLAFLVARLADNPHNMQVLVENEEQIMPILLSLVMFPRNETLIALALEAIQRLLSFSFTAPMLRRIHSIQGCLGVFVRLVCGKPVMIALHRSTHISNEDRIRAANILLKVAEGSGGIAALQEHEQELVELLTNINLSLGKYNNQNDVSHLTVLLASIMYALVPTEAPYLKALEKLEYDTSYG
ncbi:hypothetical protein GUITHDRAFT_132396 [Guillardia theta CCMP2712]|uniref:ARID domain-containing protein n=1 Tax=Guillardia theta (strain CCMP2712) TaxID=905079 RepID=L1K022_GUITC|nr:hypothetical protein GUITHDRAFT_132396 [Guillardia theta CCMP2712]EKX53967.1 hypothetical protein GUITHDRAFT_132396 [Guillardia theta CCMP2712]|eukprot:XP_005840947.1 hypothetical protein GUITHDRAFT_132396 [Guillardia theta CCMP2712]